MPGERRHDPTVDTAEYICQLERRVQRQQRQLVRMRRRSRVLLNLIVAFDSRRRPPTARRRAPVLFPFEDDVDR